MSLLISYKALITVIWFMLIFILERLYRAEPYPQNLDKAKQWGRLISNFSLAIINFILSPLLIIPLTVFISSQFISWRPEWMQNSIFIFADIIILDCFLYWWHRLNHRIPFLWRFHQVHHLDEFLDSSTAIRFHFGEVFISAIARVVFIITLGIPIETVIIFELLVLISSIFNHSNIKINSKLEQNISRIIVTPSIHWVHHHALQKDTDSNYATIFSWWDGWFGTQNSRRRWKSIKIGVMNLKDIPVLKLLIKPASKNET